ncbi:unnamed protein product [Ranitomeya imitator]|uniref:Reverse transcriptase domain-containing protein n=1 Tax=Ranitomeya imitator TaxID=111125 RepID=A0ABN9LT87_9NEOB|nr:unnamed protein product [Ranitomeya imitator]
MLGSLTNISGTEYHKVQRIPRGLRVSLRPTLFSEKADFCEKFEAILNKCSMDLILLTVDYLHKEIPIIENEIASIESQLRNTMSQEEFNKIKTHIDKTMIEFQTQLQERKRLKFIRDSDDYQRGELYRCTNKNPETTERRPYRRWNSSYSSGSESDGYRSSFRSYQGRGRNPRNRSNRQNSSAAEPPSTRMQTRSQVSTDLLVYNISSQVLSSMELQVLQRGLSFCPTPPFNDFTLDQELNRFFRSLRLKVHFSSSAISPLLATDSVISDTTLTLKKLNLVHRSVFSPPRVYHPVETYISLVKNEVRQKLMDIQQVHHRIRNNMSRAEREAIDSLRSNKKLVIKPADKGDDFFIQLNGTAMGSNVAPPYANIFMADFECKFVYTHVLFQQFCPLWKRYIDDVFLIWNGDLDSLLSFYQSINSGQTYLLRLFLSHLCSDNLRFSFLVRVRSPLSPGTCAFGSRRSALCHTSGGPLPHFRPVFHVRMRIAALIRRVLFRFED